MALVNLFYPYLNHCIFFGPHAKPIRQCRITRRCAMTVRLYYNAVDRQQEPKRAMNGMLKVDK